MPEVTVFVAGREYRMGCAEGEEAHLMHLAELVDTEAARLQRKIGQVGEGRLMLMSALMLADKMTEAQSGQAAAAEAETTASDLAEKISILEAQLAEAKSAQADAEVRADAARAEAQASADDLRERSSLYGPEREAEIASSLDALAARIETLAGRVEASA